MDPRKLTIENIESVRNMDGFPLGTDEDIIGLSNAPYYTACPNPFVEEYIKENGHPYEEDDDYHREPYTSDVSEGKHDPYYMAHGYHTKVPYMAIMRYILHYTDPGDIVLDSFCGTGMTAVAALQCGTNDYEIKEHVSPAKTTKWGARKAVVSDLSPIASFIASNYANEINMSHFYDIVTPILERLKREYGWMYETVYDGSAAQIN